jgi:hypothetical protein
MTGLKPESSLLAISAATLKFSALGEVSSGEIVEMTVGIWPFLGLSTLPSAKNLKVAAQLRQSEGV